MDCKVDLGAWNPDAFLWAINLATWAYLAILVIVVLICFHPYSDYRHPSSWEKRYLAIAWMAAACCLWNPFNAEARRRQRDRARRIGTGMCSMFGHVDLTETDVLAAFALARNMFVQEERKKKKAVADAVTAAEIDTNNAFSGECAISGVLGSGEGGGTSTADAPILITNTVNKTEETAKPFRAPSQQEVKRMGIEHPKNIPGIRLRIEPSIRGKAAEAGLETLKEAQHYFKYAFATYGWMLYVFKEGVVQASTRLCCACGARGHYGVLGPCCTGNVNKEVALNVRYRNRFYFLI